MSTHNYANFRSSEGVIKSEKIIEFDLKCRLWTINNDSSNKDLKFKFNVSESFSTLKPTETISLIINSYIIIINGKNTDYRIWAFG